MHLYDEPVIVEDKSKTCVSCKKTTKRPRHVCWEITKQCPDCFHKDNDDIVIESNESNPLEYKRVLAHPNPVTIYLNHFTPNEVENLP